MSFLRIPAAALESLSRLDVEMFPDVTDWSQDASRPAGASNADIPENVGGTEGVGKSPEDEHSLDQDQSIVGEQGSLIYFVLFFVNFCSRTLVFRTFEIIQDCLTQLEFFFFLLSNFCNKAWYYRV